jgi:predicted nucleic-acid-binding protein
VIALDTNILARVLTRDDPGQAELAADILRSPDLFLCKTVLLELEWVLRFAYGFDRPAIHGALVRLLGLPTLRVEDEPAVALALRGYDAGVDFADALHLASSAPGVTEFATFDRDLAKTAQGIEGAARIRLLGSQPVLRDGGRA